MEGCGFDPWSGNYCGEELKKNPKKQFRISMAQMVKNLPAVWETQAQSLGWEDPLEKEMAT